jgi:hypothetical protein
MNYSIDLRVDIVSLSTNKTVWMAFTSVPAHGKDYNLDFANIPINMSEFLPTNIDDVLPAIPEEYRAEGYLVVDATIIRLLSRYTPRIYFEASRRAGVPQEGRSVYIDDVELVESECSLSPPSADPDYCHPTGPVNCSFQDRTFCGWSKVNGTWNFVNIDSNLAIQLTAKTETGKVESQTSCATQTACFSFRHGFKVNHAVVLHVKVQEKSMSKKKLWFKSELESPTGENKWDLAFVSFSTSDDYVVLLEAQRIDNDVPAQEGLVYIDDIQFVPFPCDVYSALTEEESTATGISVTTNTAVTVTIALLVLTVASVALVVFCRRRRRKIRESIATRQAQELELRPLHGGVGDDIIVHHGSDPHGSLESVYDQIPNFWSPDDGTNDHYDLPEASAEEGNQMAPASTAADNVRAPSLPNRPTDHYDLPGTCCKKKSAQ